MEKNFLGFTLSDQDTIDIAERLRASGRFYHPPAIVGLTAYSSPAFITVEYDAKRATDAEILRRLPAREVSLPDGRRVPIAVIPGRAARAVDDLQKPPKRRRALAETAPVRAGGWTWNAKEPMRNAGTLGWSFRADGRTFFISNWHVLTRADNDMPLGSPIIVRVDRGDGSVVDFEGAKLHSRRKVFPLSEGVDNAWDFALAEYNPGVDVESELVACEDGEQLPYPRNFTRPDGDRDYFKVGAQIPTCNSGRWRGRVLGHVFTHLDPDHPDVTYSFVDQVLFDRMTEGGDSGAVIFRPLIGNRPGVGIAGLSMAVTVPLDDSTEILRPFIRRQWPLEPEAWVDAVVDAASETYTVANPIYETGAFGPGDDRRRTGLPEIAIDVLERLGKDL